jgi:nicotinamidase/pyrazinamidase
MKRTNTKTGSIAWNVDTQYDFMRPDGKLAVRDAQDIEPALARLTGLFERHGTRVVNTADWHFPDSAEISTKPDFVDTYPEHCMAYTPGAAFVPATRPLDAYVIDWRAKGFSRDAVQASRNVVVLKDRFSAFTGSPHTRGVIETLDPRRVIVYGVATNVCVDEAVRGLLEDGREVYVVRDAIKALPPEQARIPLETTMGRWDALGVRYTRSDKVEALLGGRT